MGMAAGQARLLSITKRLGDNELKAQSITQAKIRLSEANMVAGDEYVRALNKSQLKYSTYDAQGNVSYQKLTAANLTQYGPLKNQYVIVNSAGQAMVSEKESANYQNSDSLEEFLQNYDEDEKSWYTNLWYRMNGDSDDKSSASQQSWTVLSDADLNSSKWIQYALENGIVTLELAQRSNSEDSNAPVDTIEWKAVAYTSALDIVQDTDDTDLAKAEAKYNLALQEIQAQDKQYDSQLKKLDTEHSALESEYDSIKTTVEKNVERSFKAFS